MAAGQLASQLRRCQKLISDGGTAEEALWLLWDGSDWPERLRREAAFGGDTGRRANRDLDAVCALFEVAQRSEEVAGLRGVTAFLAEIEGQQIPADTLREAETRGTGVRAHRSPGQRLGMGSRCRRRRTRRSVARPSAPRFAARAGPA